MKITCVFGHKWNGCICERCGEIRDEGHNYTHFQPSSTGKCVGTCKCGKKQELEHDWDGEKCVRCGIQWKDTYEYAISMMDEKNYYEAFKCFERIEKGPFGGSYLTQKNSCITQAYEYISNLIAQNDFIHFDYSKYVSSELFQMETCKDTLGEKSYAYTEKVDKQICSAIMESIEKDDYQCVHGWMQSLGDHWEDICKTYFRDSDTLNLGVYGAALSCMEKKDYIAALRYLRNLPEDYPMKSEKIAECEELRQRGKTEFAKVSEIEMQQQQISWKPRSCPQSPNGEHEWESVPGSEVTIDSETRKIGYHMSRCRYCGKTEKVIDYDYDADGY